MTVAVMIATVNSDCNKAIAVTRKESCDSINDLEDVPAIKYAHQVAPTAFALNLRQDLWTLNLDPTHENCGVASFERFGWTQ